MAKVNGSAGKVVTSTNTNITAVTGNPGTTITITASGHGLSVGDKVLIEDVGGMTDLNGEHVVTVSATTFQIELGKSTSQSYTSGGTVKTCATIMNWTLDIATEPMKTTDSDVSTWDTFIDSGFKGGTGTFEAFFETATSDIALTSTALILRMDASNYYTLTAFITANTSTVDVPGTEAVKKTYTFTATSTISPTVA